MSKPEISASIQNIRLSVRFNHVIFPLNMLTFARSLPERGFQLMTELPQPDPKALGRPSFSGRLAVRGSSMVDVNSERQFIGVTDPDITTLKATFDELMHVLLDEEEHGGPLRPWFFELQAKVDLSIPRELVDRLSPICPDIERTVGFPVRKKGLRLSSSQTADSPIYFEYMMEPVLGKELSTYECVIIMRDVSIGKITDLLDALPKKAAEIATAASS